MKLTAIPVGILSLAILVTGMRASAVPRGVYVASPKKIVVAGNRLGLIFDLHCKNTHPEDFAGQPIALSDDEGDQVIGVGLLLAKSKCEPGPAKEFTFDFPVSKFGFKMSDLLEG